jgi:hypothetical protein
MKTCLFLVVMAVLLTACQKDKPLIGKRQAATLDTPLHMQMDSACLHAPNLITPNGDGINESFLVIFGEAPQSRSLVITNPNGTIVFSTTAEAQWSGYDAEFIDESGPIPYLYHLEFVTAGGNAQQVSKVFHVIRDLNNECITADVPPLFGDMLDPRRCDIPYQTNDAVCVQ